MLIGNLPGSLFILARFLLAGGLLHQFIGHTKPNAFVAEHEPQAVVLGQVSLKASAKTVCAGAVGEVLLHGRVKIAVGVGDVGAQGKDVAAIKVTSTEVAGAGAKAASTQDGGTVKASGRIAIGDRFPH